MSSNRPQSRSKADTLTPQRWQRMQELFERAVPLAADERERLLTTECTDDPALREQVLSLLLASHADSGTFEHRLDGAIEGAMRVPDMRPGEIIGRYRIVRPLGRGGMGSVYLAERADEQYQQRVALKVVARGVVLGELASRFRAER